MQEFTQAILFNQARREHMLAQLGDELIEKAISQSEFNEKYGTTHQVFTTSKLSEYVTAKIEAEGNTDEVIKGIENDFKVLEPVLIKGGSEESPRLTKVFVRKNEESEEEESEDNE